MRQSEKRAIAYSDEIMSAIGLMPHLSVELFKMALKIAYETGYVDGELEANYIFMGIPKEKENDKV